MFARLFLLLVALFAAPLAQAMPAHYLVLHEDANGVRLVSSKVVEVASIPRVASTRAWEGHGSRAEKRLAVRAVQGGRTVFETDAVTSAELRGEFAGKGGAIEGHRFPMGSRDYVVRLPVVAGARAYIDRPAADASAKKGAPTPLLAIDLDTLASAPQAKAASTADTFPVLGNGDPANRLDILIIGDGYTADQRAKFVQDAQATAGQFLSISPYNDYRNAFNFKALFVASNQSGASKPSCPETPGSPVVTVDTALKATFCSNGIRRLVTVDPIATYNYASAVPDWDLILVIVNDPEYGGSGGGYAVVTMNGNSVQVAQHEFGHTFTRLADEYTDPYPSYPPCSDASGSSRPCEPNVTDTIAPVKWSGWIDASTPVPTVAAPSDSRAAGAWDGARYQSSGMYRQCYAGIMRYLGAPFCKVDSAAFVDRLYGAGWGVPATGLSAIEPGASPSGSSVSAPAGTTVSFRARVVAPNQGVRATWLVNGQVASQSQLASGATASFDYTVPASGNAVVRLDVTDLSGISLAPRVSSQQWSLAPAAPPAYSVTVTPSGGGSGRVTSSPSGIDCGSTCTMQAAGHSAVTLTAVPAQGSRFAGWTGACAGTGPCSFTVDAAVSVGAVFEALQPGAVLAQPSSVDFGGQSLNTTSPAQVVTLSNVGQQPLQVSDIQASASFAIAQHNCGTLNPGDQCTAQVTFTPATQGTINGTMTVNSSVGARTVALSGMGERSMVTHYYDSILRRPPEPDGKAFWEAEAQRLRNLGADPNESWYAMAATMFAGAEYAALNRDDAGFIEDLYRTFFNRAPDAGGMAYWRDLLGRGLPRSAALADFTFGPESVNFMRATFGDAPVRSEIDTITDFYRGLLGRVPDDGGFSFWLGRFRAAQCAGGNAVNAEADSISSQFITSAEYANRQRDDRAFVGDLYNAFLRRGGALDGVNFWITQLQSKSMTRDAVRRAFVNSQEFQNRVAKMLSEGCAR